MIIQTGCLRFYMLSEQGKEVSLFRLFPGDVCVLLDTKAGKCTDINSVFVDLCRAAGIPAREMFGVRINADVITKNQHCWAEFYLPGTGWVAADPADVLKAVLTNSWDKSAAETLEKQEFYWGGSEAERLELSRGRDIVLSPAQDGVAVDFYSPDSFVYTISFAAEN